MLMKRMKGDHNGTSGITNIKIQKGLGHGVATQIVMANDGLTTE